MSKKITIRYMNTNIDTNEETAKEVIWDSERMIIENGFVCCFRDDESIHYLIPVHKVVLIYGRYDV